MRKLVITMRLTVEGDNAQELFENLAETTRNIEDTLIQYGALQNFTIQEVHEPTLKPCPNCGQPTEENPNRPLFCDHLCQYPCQPAQPEPKLEQVREALLKARDMIESEYCSHPTPHGRDEKRCYSSFIYAALPELDAVASHQQQ